MPFALEQLSQALSIAAKIDPQTLAQNTSLTSGSGVDMSKFHRAMAVVQIGTNTGNITAKFQAAKTSGGSFTPVTGSTTTAVTASGKVVTLEIRDDELNQLVGNGYQWLRLDVTENNVGSAPVAAVVLGGEAEAKPASAQDVSAAVAQRLVL